MEKYVEREKDSETYNNEKGNGWELKLSQTLLSEYLRPLFATPQQAVDFVDRGGTATGHYGKQTLRASGLDESQESERSKLRGMNPVAIQISLKCARLQNEYK